MPTQTLRGKTPGASIDYFRNVAEGAVAAAAAAVWKRQLGPRVPSNRLGCRFVVRLG